MVSDDNKGITAIVYNHLNLPQEITFDTGNKILYIYNAAGVKLQKQVIEGSDTTFTDYIGGFVYENDTLQFLQTAEGRVVKYPNLTSTQEWAYQYHLKDHLGNVRMTVNADPGYYEFLATMETAYESEERAIFGNYDNLTVISADIYDHTEVASPGKSIRLSGTGDEIIGFALTLPVYPGDTVRAEVHAKYTDPGADPQTSAVVGGIASAFTNSFGIVSGEDPVVYDFFNELFALGPIFTGDDTDNVPEAYLNYLYFDTNWNMVDAKYTPITSAALESGSDGPHQLLELSDTIHKEGFVYIYVSNENDEIVDVYFDDFKVSYSESPIVKITSYYPYGMEIEALSYERFGSTSQSFLYNSFELQSDLDLGLYDYGARFYDPELGRFINIDPAADLMRRYSPYSYAFDNPIRFIDPDGMMPTQSTDCPDGCDEEDSQQQEQQQNEASKAERIFNELTVGGDVNIFAGFSQALQAIFGENEIDVQEAAPEEKAESGIEDGVIVEKEGQQADGAPKGKGQKREDAEPDIPSAGKFGQANEFMKAFNKLFVNLIGNEHQPTEDSVIVQLPGEEKPGVRARISNSHGFGRRREKDVTKKDSTVHEIIINR